MPWDLIFKAAVLLAPVPVCWALSSYIKASSASLEGTVLQRLRFQVSGPLAAYLLLVAATIYVLGPDLVRGRAPLAATPWDYSLELPGTEATEGRLRFEAGPSGTLTARGEPGNDLLASQGLLSSRWIYLGLDERLGDRLVVFGELGADLTRFELPVYRLPDEWDLRDVEARDEPLRVVGRISLARHWPFLLLAYLLVLPLLVVYLLSLIGPPLIARITGKEIEVPASLALPVNRLKLELTGALAGYSIILVVVGWVLQPTNVDWSAQESRAEATCIRDLQGEWYFELYSALARQSSRLDYVGKFDVVCDEGRGIIALRNGIGNPATTPFSPGERCYGQRYPKDSFAWRSLIAAVADDRVIAIYRAGRGEDTGLLKGAVSPKGMILEFYDFAEAQRHPEARNRGYLKAVRPDSDSVRDCSAIRARWSRNCGQVESVKCAV